MIPSLLLFAACLTPADNGRSPSPYSKDDPDRTVQEKHWLVGTIVVIGNTRTPQSIVLRRVPTHPGWTVIESDLRAAEAALKQLKIFNRVAVWVVDPDEHVCRFHDVLVMVEERKGVDARDECRLMIEDAAIDGMQRFVSFLLAPEVAGPICDVLEDFPIFKVRSGCEPLVEDMESFAYLSIAVPLWTLREMQQAVANLLRDPLPQ